MLVAAAFFAPVLAAPARAQSNEPETPALAAGGLVLVPSTALALEQHDLTLSLAQIRSTMVLRNLEPRPREIEIAFPLPDIDAASVGEAPVAVARNDQVNFVAALITADGQPIVPRVSQRAYALELDVTDALLGAGLPLFPFGEAIAAAMGRLADAKRVDLVARGVLREEDGRLLPHWTLKTTLRWR